MCCINVAYFAYLFDCTILKIHLSQGGQHDSYLLLIIDILFCEWIMNDPG